MPCSSSGPKFIVKLYYFQDPHNNFGDDLNPWLWPKLLPGLGDDRNDELLVGIGTLINHRLPSGPLKHIVGSGVGYGRLPTIDATYRFHALRGYESAKALGQSSDVVVTDPAVLIRAMQLPPVDPSRARCGLVLTGRSLDNFDWEPVCQQAGIAFISCRWSVDKVLAEMRRCDVVLTEAMHGAIVADALRVPWVPVNCSQQLLSFKWRDWLSSLRLPYEPSQITPLFDASRNFSLSGRVKNAVKLGMRRAGLWHSDWAPPRPHLAGPVIVEKAVAELHVAAQRKPFLSDEALLKSHTQRYLDIVGNLQEVIRPSIQQVSETS